MSSLEAICIIRNMTTQVFKPLSQRITITQRSIHWQWKRVCPNWWGRRSFHSRVCGGSYILLKLSPSPISGWWTIMIMAPLYVYLWAVYVCIFCETLCILGDWWVAGVDGVRAGSTYCSSSSRTFTSLRLPVLPPTSASGDKLGPQVWRQHIPLFRSSHPPTF